jgi:hypothetical protein
MMRMSRPETEAERLRSEPAKTRRTPMHTNISRKTAILVLIGLVAIAIVVL